MTTDIQNKKVIYDAISEFNQEEHRRLVEAEKDNIRAKRAGRKWWHKLFPFVISFSIRRRNDN